MSAIKVNNPNGSNPTMTLGKKPFQVNKTTVNVLQKGTGATLGADQVAVVNYAVADGASGKMLTQTFTTPVPIYMKDPSQFPGLITALKNVKVGTTETVAIPPADGFGTSGNSTYGIAPTDTLVFYMKVTAATNPLVSGTDAAPKSGFPRVKMNGPASPATITMPNANPSKTLESQTLINGTGATVKKGQTLIVAYTGVVWVNGKAGTLFDSTGSRAGAPASFVIGEGKVITGWDKTLVGKKVGDRVLMVVPPADGYGSAGQTDSSGATIIKGTDTIVFVVDILGVG